MQSTVTNVEASLSVTPTPDPSVLEKALTAATREDGIDMEAFEANLPPTPEADATPKPINLDEVDEETLKAAIEDAVQEENLDTAINRGMDIALAVGFGNSVYLFLLAPLVLLFSYTRKPKYPWMGMLVPVAGCALIFVAYVEGVHQILYLLPVGKVNLDELREMVAVGASMIQ